MGEGTLGVARVPFPLLLYSFGNIHKDQEPSSNFPQKGIPHAHKPTSSKNCAA
jgi:hypothetical protein